jgi:hypothetical protein
MPKNNIDYSNTIIYKIYCKDNKIKEMYVGHTTNFTKRKCAHKSGTYDLNNSSKIYKAIRDNGGWDNWEIVEIAKYNCKDVTEARIKEQEHFQILQSTLNSINPYVNKAEFYCKICDIQFNNLKCFEQHIKTNKHNINNIHFLESDKYNVNKKENELKYINNKYFCESCSLKTNNKKDFEKHLTTSKHIKLTNSYNFDLEFENNEFTCDKCNKNYKSRVGLWKHKKICESINSNTNENISNQITPELILNVLEHNKELTNLVIEQNKTIMELAKSGHGNNISNNNINSNNKTFNLQVFLNETCKDAMNITDFVDSLKLQLADLENIGRVGFVEGISSIIVKNLQALDVHKRPVHCADKKREVLYIKDEDKWEKEDEEKNKMRKVIKKVANKNQRLLSKYKEEHPGCNYSESKYSDQYSKIVIEAMGGSGGDDSEKENKIIQKIAKEVVIDKNN